MLDDAPCPAAALDAVLFAPCVEALGASPGNCTAACGLTDGEALMPAEELADAGPVAAGPAPGAAVNDEPTPDELASQPSAIERLPMNEPPEQVVPGRLAAPVVVAPNAEALDDVTVAEVPAADIVPFCEAPCETV